MSASISAEQWAERKDEILRLYIEEGWALRPVMRAMRDSRFNPSHGAASESQYRTKLKKWGLRKPRNQRKQRMVETDFSVLVDAPPSGAQASSDHSSVANHDNTLVTGPSADMFPSSPAQSSYTWPEQLQQHINQPGSMGVAVPPAAHGTPYDHVDVSDQAYDFAFDGTSDGPTFADLQRDSKTIVGRSTGGGLSSYHDGLLPDEYLQSPKYPQAYFKLLASLAPDASNDDRSHHSAYG
ncbi:MAG: hypothetical protein Q9183_003150 [Haloplaca sp. 2 TL-2023]